MSISVVMTVYNGERFLAQAIESTLHQTLRNFEFVIVNDGSTDASRQIIQGFESKDGRIKFIDLAHVGYAAALNTGVEQASHDLIAILDADDEMMPQRLERQLQFMSANPEISVACSHAFLIDVAGQTIGISKNAVDVDRGRRELTPNLFSEIVHPSALIRKGALLEVGGYRDVYFCADRDLWGRVATHGLDIRCQPECLVRYRLHLGALSARTMRRNALSAACCDANVIRRLKGESEITFETFLRERDQRSLHAKIGDYREMSALMFYKRSTRYRGERMYAKCVGSLAAAVVLDPMPIIKRTWSSLSSRGLLTPSNRGA